MYVWEVWQQQCLEGDSIACFKKHLNGLLPGYQRKKKNDKPIFWHFSLDHFFFQIHKAHFSPLEEYNKTKNSINGFYLASSLDDEIMNYKVLIIMLTWSWKMFHLDHSAVRCTSPRCYCGDIILFPLPYIGRAMHRDGFFNLDKWWN